MKYHYEKVLTSQTESFATVEEIGNVIDSVFHVHPEYELTYVVSSFGTRFIGDSISMYDKEDLVLIGPMLPHHYYNSPADSQSDDWSFLKVIKFREDFAGSTFFDLPEIASIKKMLQAAGFGLEFPLTTSRKVKTLLDQLDATSSGKRLILFLEILECLADSDYKTLSTLPKQQLDLISDNRINQVLQYLHRRIDLGQELSLTAAAKRICMTPQAFSRYFKKATRKNFIEYVNAVKIGKACQRLLNTDQTIATISFDTGFNNLSNFNRQFAKHKGMSPKEFRHQFWQKADAVS